MVIMYLVSFISSLFSCATESKPKNSMVVSMGETNQYLCKEIDQELPGYIEGVGYHGKIGAEHLQIMLYSPSDNEEKNKEITLQAYTCASRGLSKCKKLFNHTNHGISSPNLIYLQMRDESPKSRQGVLNGQFYPENIPDDTKWTDIKDNDNRKAFLNRIFEDKSTNFVTSVYETKIEKNVVAFGLEIWMKVEAVPSVEDCKEYYRKKYQELNSFIEQFYPEHFLMFKLVMEQPDISEYAVYQYNIRNHLHLFEQIPDEKYGGVECKRQHHPNFLDDLVPESLQRPWVK